MLDDRKWTNLSRTCSKLFEPSTVVLPFVRYTVPMSDPDTHLLRLNQNMIYLGVCLIGSIRLAKEAHVNHRVIPTSNAIYESVDLAREI